MIILVAEYRGSVGFGYDSAGVPGAVSAYFHVVAVGCGWAVDGSPVAGGVAPGVDEVDGGVDDSGVPGPGFGADFACESWDVRVYAVKSGFPVVVAL